MNDIGHILLAAIAAYGIAGVGLGLLVYLNSTYKRFKR